jgi:hypothetical protein
MTARKNAPAEPKADPEEAPVEEVALAEPESAPEEAPAGEVAYGFRIVNPGPPAANEEAATRPGGG